MARSSEAKLGQGLIELVYSYGDGLSINNIALVSPSTPYEEWAFARGLTLGMNSGFFDDPNSDGEFNFESFAFDNDPLGLVNSADKNRFVFIDVGGQVVLTGNTSRPPSHAPPSGALNGTGSGRPNPPRKPIDPSYHECRR